VVSSSLRVRTIARSTRRRQQKTRKPTKLNAKNKELGLQVLQLNVAMGTDGVKPDKPS
jgi:hypothetical protein